MRIKAGISLSASLLAMTFIVLNIKEYVSSFGNGSKNPHLFIAISDVGADYAGSSELFRKPTETIQRIFLSKL